jgi:hypothetical protein
MFTKQVSMFVLAALLLLTSCSSSAQNIKGEHWVIFSETLAEEQQLSTWFLFGDESIEYWTPSEQDVIAIEDGLIPYLEQNAERFYVRDIPVWERLDDYNRQYIGILVDGRRIVYANYFCDSVVDWEKEFVIVMDGGDCFFQFQYDLDTAEYFDLQVNGSA